MICLTYLFLVVELAVGIITGTSFFNKLKFLGVVSQMPLFGFKLEPPFISFALYSPLY